MKMLNSSSPSIVQYSSPENKCKETSQKKAQGFIYFGRMDNIAFAMCTHKRLVRLQKKVVQSLHIVISHKAGLASRMQIKLLACLNQQSLLGHSSPRIPAMSTNTHNPQSHIIFQS